MPRTLLYLPGLGGDATTTRQQRYLSGRLKRSQTSLVFFDPKWSSNESYDKKWSRLQALIDTCDLKETTAIGISAGGSLLMRVLADYPEIKKAHAVCAKLQNSAGIGPDFRKRAPALFSSVVASEKALRSSDKFAYKLTTFQPLFDEVVPLADMRVAATRNKRLPIVGHVLSIGWYLAFKLPRK